MNDLFGQHADAKNVPLEDVTERSYRMPRGSCLIYRRKRERWPGDAPFGGVITMPDGTSYWVGLWMRLCKGWPCFELKLTKRGVK